MAISLGLSSVSSPALAEQAPAAGQYEIHVKAASLAEALAILARQTGATIGTPGQLPLVPTKAIQGRMTIEAALRQLLAGTGLHAVPVRMHAYRIEARQDLVRSPRISVVPPEGIGQPIEVTATKRPELLGALPLSVFVAQPRQIEMQGSLSGSDAIARLDERVTLVGMGPGRNRIFLRGIADSPFNGPAQSTVGVMFGDGRLTYSAPDPDIRLIDVARVEVLDGPQGFLQGAGAIGGLYRIVPNQPVLGRTEASTTVAGSTLKDGSQGFSGAGMLNLPIAESSALRAVVYGEKMPGWIDTGVRHDTNRGDLFGLRLAWTANIAPNWQIDLGALHQRLAVADSEYVAAPMLRQRTLAGSEPHDNDLDHLTARIEGQIGAMRLVGQTSKTWHEASDTYVDPQGGHAVDDRRFRTWDNEVRLDGHDGKFRWLVGISYVMAQQNLARTYSADLSQSVRAGQASARTSHDLALFGSVDVPIGQAFDLSVGGRLLRGTVEDVIDMPAGRFAASTSKIALTPAITLAWRRDSNDSIYLRGSTGFRQGGLTQGTGGVFKTDGDELRSVELGWRHQTPGLVLEANLHHGQWRDIQSDVLLANGQIVTRNIGDANLNGLNMRAEIALSEGWAVSGGVYLLATQFDTIQAGDGDTPLPFAAPVQGRIQISKEAQWGKWRGTVQGDLSYVGSRDFFIRSETSSRLAPLSQFGASVRLQRDRLTLMLRGSNLLDSRRPDFAFGNPLSAASQTQLSAPPPRSIEVSVALKF